MKKEWTNPRVNILGVNKTADTWLGDEDTYKNENGESQYNHTCSPNCKCQGGSGKCSKPGCSCHCKS